MPITFSPPSLSVVCRGEDVGGKIHRGEVSFSFESIRTLLNSEVKQYDGGHTGSQ